MVTITFALLNWLIFKLLYCYQKKICVIIVGINTNNPAKTTCLRSWETRLSEQSGT